MEMLTEAALEQHAATVVTDEQVLAVGVVQAFGAGFATGEGAGLGSEAAHDLHLPGAAGFVLSAAAGYAAHRGMSAASNQPQFTALVVTPTRILAFDATAHGGMAATPEFSSTPYATWDRATAAVHVSKHVSQYTLAIDDPATGVTHEYTGNKLWKNMGKTLMHVLSDEADR